jgi:hypothetical protein
MEHLSHDNQMMEDEHFAEVMASSSLIRIGVVPNQELCERWLNEGYVNEEELEMILETYEEITDV